MSLAQAAFYAKDHPMMIIAQGLHCQHAVARMQRVVGIGYLPNIQADCSACTSSLVAFSPGFSAYACLWMQPVAAARHSVRHTGQRY
jgi:hypothetical protein